MSGDKLSLEEKTYQETRELVKNMEKIASLNKHRNSSIYFPPDVEITPCKVITHRQIEKTIHGVVVITVRDILDD